MKKISVKKGFSLVEMMVAITIFTIVIAMGMGALLSTITANRYSKAKSVTSGFVNIVLEQMFRDVSAGSEYHCGDSGSLDEFEDCSSFDSEFYFEYVSGDVDDEDDQYGYKYDQVGKTILRTVDSGDSYQRLLDETIIVETFDVMVVGDPTDDEQPGVFLSMSGYVQADSERQVRFEPQIMITQRINPTILVN